MYVGCRSWPCADYPIVASLTLPGVNSAAIRTSAGRYRPNAGLFDGSARKRSSSPSGNHSEADVLIHRGRSEAQSKEKSCQEG